MVPSDLAFPVDPGWYDGCWYAKRSRPKYRHFTGAAARLAVLLTGGPGMTVRSGAPDEREATRISIMGARDDMFVYFMS